MALAGWSSYAMALRYAHLAPGDQTILGQMRT